MSSLRRPAAVALVALVAVLALLFGLAPLPAPTPADALPIHFGPSTIKAAYQYDGFGNTGDVPMPDCDSVNITGKKSFATWTVTSELGHNSTILVGDEWQITAVLEQKAWVNGNSYGNDGPSPLNVALPVGGPAVPGAPTIVDQDWKPLDLYYEGPGSVGPLGPFGPWGWQFDSNSSPKAATLNDGVLVKVTVTVRATAPGTIKLPALVVSGHDGTPIAADFACSMPIGWTWNVEQAGNPVGKADSAATDTAYDNLTPHDAADGSHGIAIDVLANDDDPNTWEHVGDPDEVRIADWQPLSAHGGIVRCGTDQQKGLPAVDANFGALATGPCTYKPKTGFAGTDTFGYVVRQKTKNLQTAVTVTVQVHPNNPPWIAPASFGAAANSDADFDLAPSLVSAPGDVKHCIPALKSAPFPAVGTVTLASDCSFHWDNTSPGFTGSVSFDYWACDDHPLLSEAEVGAAADKLGDYATGDLNAQSSRRCDDGEATITILPGLVIPPTGVGDHDIVDAGYASDVIGPYSVDLDVLANDTDGNGPKPSMPSAGLAVIDPPAPGEGTATVVNGKVRFTPANGFSGEAAFTYRVCEDPAAQNPPYADDPNTPLIDEGLPYCGTGVAVVEVVGNDAPQTADDHVVLGSLEVLDGAGFDLATNDVDPEGGVLTCKPGIVGNTAPQLFTSISVTPSCGLLVDPVDDGQGQAVVGYSVCDDHTLSQPTSPANPYGADGRSPGDAAPRCDEGEVVVDIVRQGEAPADDAWELDPAPVCADDAGTTPQDTPLTLEVLANDSDLNAKGEPGPLELSIDEPDVSAQGGTVTYGDEKDQLRYTPPAGFSGEDTVTYAAVDDLGKGCTAVVHLTVTADGDGGNGGNDGNGGGTGDGNGGDGTDDGTVRGDSDVTGTGTTSTTAPGGTNRSGAAATTTTAGLPVTGTSTGPLVLAGVGLVLAGALLRRAGRRPAGPID